MGRAFEYRRAAKEKRWDKMSRLFPRLGKTITMAAKTGGPDPEMNATLRAAIQNAKAQNMPKVNIENAIKRATDHDMADFVEIIYEAKAPHGVLLYIECATDNSTRTVANVKAYLNKAGGQLVPNGSMDFMFNRKAVFEINAEVFGDRNLEEMELELIDSGLEEIEKDDEGNIVIYGDYTSFGTLQSALDELKLEVNKADLQRFPTTPIDLSDEEMEEIEKLLDKIEEDDDVQNVFTNIN